MATKHGKSRTPSRVRTAGMIQPRRYGRRWLAGLAAGAAVAVLALLVVVGLAGGRGEAPQGTAVSSTQAPAPGPRVKLSVPDVRLKGMAWQGGREFVLSENADKPTIMEFTASYCIPCIPTLKAMTQLEREMGDQLNFVVMSIDPNDTEQAMQRLSEVVGGAPGIWAIDKNNVVTQAYDIRALGVTVIVANGHEIYRSVGSKSIDQLRAALAKAQQAGQ